MKNTIIITGATGFSGSHSMKHFIEEKEVIASCRNHKKLPNSWQDRYLEGDLKDKNYIESLTKKADVICHTASWAEMNGSVEDSKKNFLEPTLHLINRAIANNVKRFVFLSAITSKPIEENRIHSTLPLGDIWAHYDSIMKIEEHLKSISKEMDIMIVRAGYFTGENYALGLLPILLPRLKTHLVPYIKNGTTTLPLIDGNDLGLALKLASTVQLQKGHHIIEVVGKETPTVKEVLTYLHQKYAYPLPHFSVSFGFAYAFARSMRAVHRILPIDPLIVPAVVLLLEETHANNDKAKNLLGYTPQVNWQASIDRQIAEMNIKQTTYMRMNK